MDLLKSLEASPLPSVKVGEDSRYAALRHAIPQAIMLRANQDIPASRLEEYEARLAKENPGGQHPGKVHELAHQLKHATLCNMYREYLRPSVRRSGDGHADPASRSDGPAELSRHFPKFAALAESTSDFPSLTLDAINKTLRFIYRTLRAPGTSGRRAAPTRTSKTSTASRSLNRRRW